MRCQGGIGGASRQQSCKELIFIEINPFRSSFLVGRETALRQRILKEYGDLVFYKDLVERYRVSNPLVLRQLLKYCLGNPASLLNVHKLYSDFQSRGFELLKNTLYNYLGYLGESYIVFSVPICSGISGDALSHDCEPSLERPSTRR
ncbi:MAG: hypothetical protein WDO56_08385 [Gammaproteobacteria bacterium]